MFILQEYSRLATYRVIVPYTCVISPVLREILALFKLKNVFKITQLLLYHFSILRNENFSSHFTKIN